jgi:hypothetical protein
MLQFNSVLDNNEVKDALAQHIVKGEHILRDALAGMEASYNTTLWWGPASDAVNNYMEHGSILARSGVSRMASTATAEQCNATIASDGSTSIAVDASSDIQQAAAGVGAFSTALSQFPMFSNMVSALHTVLLWYSLNIICWHGYHRTHAATMMVLHLRVMRVIHCSDFSHDNVVI